jgi:hypothetical protein
MTQITYSFVGVNTGQLASSINNLRRSSTYRQIEVDASTRYSHVVVVMGPNINPPNETGLHRLPAVSGRNARDPGTLYVFLDTTTSAARSTPSGELALTVDQLIAHEMAHATFPPLPIGGDVFGGRPSEQLGAEEDSVIRLSDAVSADLGIIGNTGSPQYKDNPGPLSTFGDSYAANPLILKFGDGTRANVGYGPLDGAPTVGGTIYGFKRLEVSGDTATQRGTAQETHSEEQNVSDGWQRSVLPSILGMDTTLGTMGGFTGTVFDSGNNQPRSQQTSTFRPILHRRHRPRPLALLDPAMVLGSPAS